MPRILRVLAGKTGVLLSDCFRRFAKGDGPQESRTHELPAFGNRDVRGGAGLAGRQARVPDEPVAPRVDDLHPEPVGPGFHRRGDIHAKWLRPDDSQILVVQKHAGDAYVLDPAQIEYQSPVSRVGRQSRRGARRRLFRSDSECDRPNAPPSRAVQAWRLRTCRPRGRGRRLSRGPPVAALARSGRRRKGADDPPVPRKTTNQLPYGANGIDTCVRPPVCESLRAARMSPVSGSQSSGLPPAALKRHSASTSRSLWLQTK